MNPPRKSRIERRVPQRPGNPVGGEKERKGWVGTRKRSLKLENRSPRSRSSRTQGRLFSLRSVPTALYTAAHTVSAGREDSARSEGA